MNKLDHILIKLLPNNTHLHLFWKKKYERKLTWFSMQFIRFPTLKEKINHLDLPRNLNLWPMIIKHEQDHPLMCYRSFLQILTKSGHQFWIYRWYTNRIAYSIDNIFVQEWPSCVKYLYTSTTFQTPYESIWRFLLISFI